MESNKIIAKGRHELRETFIVFTFLFMAAFATRIFWVAFGYHPIPMAGLIPGSFIIAFCGWLLYLFTQIRLFRFYENRMQIKRRIGIKVELLYYSDLDSWFTGGKKEEKDGSRTLHLVFKGKETISIPAEELSNFDSLINTLSYIQHEDTEAVFIYEKELDSYSSAKVRKYGPYLVLGCLAFFGALVAGVYYANTSAMVSVNDLVTIEGALANKSTNISSRGSSYVELSLNNYTKTPFKVNSLSSGSAEDFEKNTQPGDSIQLDIRKTDLESYLIHRHVRSYWKDVFWMEGGEVKGYGLRTKDEIYTKFEYSNSDARSNMIAGMSAFGGIGLFITVILTIVVVKARREA